MVTGSKTVDYLLDGQNVVRELTTENGQTTTTATYLNGPRGPEYKRDAAGAVQWYVYDGLGSVAATVDSQGNVTSSRKYDVYGATRGGSGDTTRHGFCGSLGHSSDPETGLAYMRARYYDPATGRFVSEDPARNGGNWFLYANAAPTKCCDPDGKAGTKILGVDLVQIITIFLGGKTFGYFAHRPSQLVHVLNAVSAAAAVLGVLDVLCVGMTSAVAASAGLALAANLALLVGAAQRDAR